METLAQYEARMARARDPQAFAEPQSVVNEVKWCNQLKEYKVFTVVAADEAREIEASARTRGAVKAFFDNLTNFYSEWSPKNEGKPFLVNLTEAGAPFAGKKPESVYSSISQHMSKNENLKAEWRLIRKKDEDEIQHVYIAHL